MNFPHILNAFVKNLTKDHIGICSKFHKFMCFLWLAVMDRWVFWRREMRWSGGLREICWFVGKIYFSLCFLLCFWVWLYFCLWELGLHSHDALGINWGVLDVTFVELPDDDARTRSRHLLSLLRVFAICSFIYLTSLFAFLCRAQNFHWDLFLGTRDVIYVWARVLEQLRSICWSISINFFGTITYKREG